VLGKPNQSKAGVARMSNAKALAETEAAVKAAANASFAAATGLTNTATPAPAGGGGGGETSELARKSAEASRKLAAEMNTRRIALCWPQPPTR